MKYTTPLMIILSIAVSGCIVQSTEPQKVPAFPSSTSNQITIPIPNVISPIPTPTTTETPYPKPTYIPTLTPMNCYNKNDEIWRPCDPSSYIQPNNEWVKYYADKLFVDTDGRIKYKNEKQIVVKYLDGTLGYDNKLFENNYVTLREYFGREIANNDYWINADYYLYNGQKGICSSWMIAVTSMMLSGEMSIKHDNNFIKQVIPAKAVLGYQGANREYYDGWIEYEAYGNSFFSSSGLIKESSFSNKMMTYTIFEDKDESYKNRHITLVFEFTNKYFKKIS